MSLQNFGSILSFAIELEASDKAFYLACASNPACAQCKSLLEELAAHAGKNEKLMLRTRRENVTEMILEPIRDFTKTPFLANREGADGMDLDQVLAKAVELEEKAERFYTEAAEKIKGLPEVARALARAATGRAANKGRIERGASSADSSATG